LVNAGAGFVEVVDALAQEGEEAELAEVFFRMLSGGAEVLIEQFFAGFLGDAFVFLGVGLEVLCGAGAVRADHDEGVVEDFDSEVDLFFFAEEVSFDVFAFVVGSDVAKDVGVVGSEADGNELTVSRF